MGLLIGMAVTAGCDVALKILQNTKKYKCIEVEISKKCGIGRHE